MNEVKDTNELKQIEQEIISLKTKTVQNIIDIGKRLIDAKKLLPHGEWGKWLKEKVNFSQNTAISYMQIAREYGENSQAIGNLDITKVMLLLTLPVDQREQFLNNPDVETMTTRELKAEINHVKTATIDDDSRNNDSNSDSATDNGNEDYDVEMHTHLPEENKHLFKDELPPKEKSPHEQLCEIDLEIFDIECKIRTLDDKKDRLLLKRHEIFIHLDELSKVKFKWVDCNDDNPLWWKLVIYVEYEDKSEELFNSNPCFDSSGYVPSEIILREVANEYKQEFCFVWKQAYDDYMKRRNEYESTWQQSYDQDYSSNSSIHSLLEVSNEDRAHYRKMYRELCKIYHPDNSNSGDPEMMVFVNKLKVLLGL